MVDKVRRDIELVARGAAIIKMIVHDGSVAGQPHHPARRLMSHFPG